MGYFSQEHEELHDSWQVVEEVMNHFNYTEEKARNVLGSFLFKGDDVFKLVGDLSLIHISYNKRVIHQSL